MDGVYLRVDCFHHLDESYRGGLLHSAVVTPLEAALHLGDYRLQIVGFMLAEEAEAMTLTERGLAHLDPEAR